MEQIRKPFQGVLNIIKFNWHFYLLSFLFLVGLIILSYHFHSNFLIYILFLFTLVFVTTFFSLLVSYYIYDLSGLYKFNWLAENNDKIEIVNISAGFDETSTLLKSKFENANLTILDFYNPKTHTEVSIKRARKAYPILPNTKVVTTSNILLTSNSADKIFVTLSAHEIRNNNERVVFFNELSRVLKPEGQILVTEHLRDCSNFIAYNIGFLHFLSKSSWNKTFSQAKLTIKKEQKITAFVTVFTLEKYAIST